MPPECCARSACISAPPEHVAGFLRRDEMQFERPPRLDHGRACALIPITKIFALSAAVRDRSRLGDDGAARDDCDAR